MRTGKSFLYAIILLVVIFIDTTFFKNVGWAGVRPDFVLVLLVFMAHSTGSFKAILLGFIAGLFLDALTLAPFGYFGLIYSVTGYLFGKSKGKVFLDPLFFPLLLLFFASLLKMVLSALLDVVFLASSEVSSFSAVSWLELVMNMILSPFVFGILKVTGLMNGKQREGF